ncbi:glycoside hydrolase family 26 protein [Mycobacterium sp. pV006]|uniref:glycoside hydrolase family 26 protein n=1 Tax=Mycobacterium sp. pV006 TaxID=3238983 RepID=UPI00351BBC5E
MAGRPLDRVMWFEEFTAAPPVRAIAAVTAMGAVPVVTWEPWRWDRRPSPTMAMLSAGLFDDHVRRWARALGATGSEVHLRFGHEFNGHWYPWSVPGGTTAARFVDVWRRIHRIFEQEDAHNVRWVWSANAGLDSRAPLEQWFPGSDHVDVLGIDGYNWGTSQPWSSWIEPDELFAATVAELQSLVGDKPMTISEVGCAEAGGSKPEWIHALIAYLCGETTADGLVWFDHHKETDWRTTSSKKAAEAMGSALRSAQRQMPTPAGRSA